MGICVLPEEGEVKLLCTERRIIIDAVKTSGSLGEVIMKCELRGLEHRHLKAAFRNLPFWADVFRELRDLVINPPEVDGLSRCQASIRILSRACTVLEGIIKKSSKKDCWISSVACLECLDQITDIADYADVGDAADDYLLVWCCLAPVLAALRKKAMAGGNACCFDRRVNKIKQLTRLRKQGQ